MADEVTPVYPEKAAQGRPQGAKRGACREGRIRRRKDGRRDDRYIFGAAGPSAAKWYRVQKSKGDGIAEIPSPQTVDIVKKTMYRHAWGA